MEKEVVGTMTWGKKYFFIENFAKSNTYFCQQKNDPFGAFNWPVLPLTGENFTNVFPI